MPGDTIYVDAAIYDGSAKNIKQSYIQVYMLSQVLPSAINSQVLPSDINSVYKEPETNKRSEPDQADRKSVV